MSREPTSRVEIEVNGQIVAHDVPNRTLLVDFLRDVLDLTGTHTGCDTSQCGACTVHLDGIAIKSCTIFAVQAHDKVVTTIEGLDPDGRHPLQTCFQECHALQCGFCTPGMIMAAASLLNVVPEPDAEDVREALEGNLCRCTGYQPIVEAVLRASKELAQ
ncbi:carbon monoxide dehydrogenase [Novosphingobium sp. AAP83]|uniref:(2Fe-2S)-binding protein n=1 Tax=Novosphingobium sp. AAP83 TaxID=1523425 RepID=UPI0006B93806|nr:(2Fe-2S)-binding protein [Novosphingobium sp. AAP83]KPF89323.1 carbon monoxide dehydrogenase [Novosphingobium sp. AAP83]